MREASKFLTKMKAWEALDLANGACSRDAQRREAVRVPLRVAATRNCLIEASPPAFAERVERAERAEREGRVEAVGRKERRNTEQESTSTR